MRTLLRLCAVILFFLPTFAIAAPPAIVQNCTGSTVVGTSITTTCGSNFTQGNLIAACYGSKSDTGPNIPTGWAIAERVDNGTNGDSVLVAYKIAGASEGNSVTMDGLDNAGGTGLKVFEVSNIASIPLDVTSKTSPAPTTGATSTNVGTTATTTVADAFALACGYARSSISDVSWDNGFTNYTPLNISTTETYFGTKILSSTGTVTTVYGGGGAFTPSATVMGVLTIFKGGTPDTTPPTDPSNMVLTPQGSEVIKIDWTASTDAVGVTNYILERCAGSSCTDYAVIANPASNTYTDRSLVASATYRYRVKATDGVNQSGYAAAVHATTLGVRTVGLTWVNNNSSPAEDGTEVWRKTGPSGTYALIATTAAGATTYSDTTSPVSTVEQSACYKVRAIKAGYTESPYSNEACAPAFVPAVPGGKVAAGSFVGVSIR